MPPEPDLPAASPPPAQCWTAQEQWIWERTLDGEVADFNVRYHEAERLDPKQDDVRWSDDEKPRLVSKEFLFDVLGRKCYLQAIPSRGLRIVGACFASDLDLESLHVERQVWLEHSRFEGAVTLEYDKFDTILSFEGSVFKQVLKMTSLTVGQHLALQSTRFAGEVVLLAAKVDGQLSATGARFEAGLNMNSLKVRESLYLDDTRVAGKVDLVGAKVDGILSAHGARFGARLELYGLTVGQDLFLWDSRFEDQVSLVSAKIHGELNADRARFETGLDMRDLTVGHGLLLRNARFEKEVSLVSATIGWQLDADGARFEADLDMHDLTVRYDLSLHGTERFEGKVNLDNAKIDGQLDAHGAHFAGTVSLMFANVGSTINLGGATFGALVDASGLTAQGELRLNPPPTWADHARFVLRNAHIGALNVGGDPMTGGGNQNPWPKHGELELDGFSYSRIGGVAAEGTTEVRPRTVNWYRDWLARDTSYTPQPYQHLAGVLRAHGDPSAANAVLYAARERERTEAWKQMKAGPTAERLKAAIRWFSLSLLKWTMGYGLGWRYIFVPMWVILFTAVGAVILWTSGADKIRPAADSAPSVGLGAPEASSTKQGL